MAAAEMIAGERVGTSRWKWIISAQDDLVWFIGSVVASYALLLALRAGASPLAVFLFWALVFDGPHVFGTFSRTYLDAEERRERARLLRGSLLFFAIGPLLYLAGYALWFFFLASLWAYYHLVKQHYGFMVLYKKKNGDLHRLDNFIDRAFLLLAFTCPFVHFINVNFAAHKRVPFPVNNWWSLLFEKIILWMFLISAFAFLSRQLQKMMRGESLNWPKHLLLMAAIPMHWIVFASLATDPYGPILAVPLLTIFHNIQYHRLIWFHNKNKYRDDADAHRRYGLAVTISKHFLIYAAVGLLFNLIYHVPRYVVFSPDGLPAAILWGYAFIHYYLDSKIWRVRSDVRLTENLRMQPV